MNLLLFLTALLTSLTGMISGDRAVSRVQAAAMAAEQTGEIVQAAAPATIAQTLRPVAQLPTLRQTSLALPAPLALPISGRLTPEKRRE